MVYFSRSWKRAFLYTCNPEDDVDDAGSLHAFLSHPESIRLLSNGLNPFPSPSTKSKSDFESKSSAIHSETTTQASYDWKEIKADALWLSGKAGIDEITALRIAVLEWQNRPAARLLTRFSEEEATSLQNAAGVDNLCTSLVGANFTEILSQKTGSESNVSELASEEGRRLRLRNLYISERSHAIKTSRKLLTLSLYNHCQDKPTLHRESGNDRRDSLRTLGETIFSSKFGGEGWRQFLQDCINAVRSRLTALEGDGGWLGASESSEEVEDMWRTILVEEIVHILQMLFLQLQASLEIPSAGLLISWLQLMADYNFLESLQVVSLAFFLRATFTVRTNFEKPCQDSADIQLSLQGLVSLATLTFLKLPLSIPFIVDKTQSPTPDKLPYFLAKDEISQINELFMTACVDFKTAHPAAFSWGLALHTMRELALNDKETRELEQFHSAVDSFQSNTPHASPGRELELSLYEELLDCARTPKYNVDECIVLLTSDAMKNSVFETVIALATKVGSTSAIDDILASRWIRVALLDLIRVAIMFMDYSPEIVESVLAILTGSLLQSPWASDTSPASSNDPRWIFMKDRLLMDNIFHIARSRFPYETAPFLKLCRSLVSKDLVNEDGLPEIINELEYLDTFTQIIPPNFQGYETIREDENANYVALAQSLPMFDSTPRRQISDSDANNALVVTGSSQIPSTTEGQVVSESKPVVVMWHHQYSCLSFLGSWLEEWNENGGYSSGWGEDSIGEVIGLLADLLSTARDVHSPNDVSSGAKRILEMASDGLSRQSDVVSLIFEIFERNLQNIGPRAVLDGVLDSIIACLRFIQGLVTVLPGRVWPLLARSSLLGSDGKGGVMTAIVSAIEVPSGDYPFLLSCVSLFECIVGDAASRAVLRRSPNSVMSKLPVASDWGAGVPSHIMRGIMLNFLRTMVEVYNSNVNWRFNAPDQRLNINTALAQIFESILYYAYGTNDTGKLDTKVTGVFSASASYVLDILRPQSTADLPFNQILRLIIDGLQSPPTLYLRYLALVEGQVKSTLALSTRILQAAQLQEYPISLLEDQLFKATPALVKLYALHDAYRLPVVSLLDMLITRAAADSVNEPPSLVGHLGAESACLFLDVLSQFDQPLSHRSLHLAVWHLLSVLVSKRQPWLAVYILTGSSPRQSLKKDDTQKTPTMRGAPFLQIALDRLSNIEQVDSQIAVSLLEFVSYAQEHWPWATPELRKHPHFFNSIVSYVSKLKINSLSVVEQIFATRIAALVADLCAVYLHSAKEMQDQSFVKTLIPLVSWFSKDAVEVSGYNASLHANLKKNFEMRYSGCKLVDFKKSSLETRNLGRGYYFDTAFGEKLLSYDFAWAGTRNQGFAEEFERANINLSLVEAQVVCYNGVGFFFFFFFYSSYSNILLFFLVINWE